MDLSNEVPAEARASRLLCCLDRAIVLLMVAILLTLSFPVCVALWPGQRAAPSAVTAPATPDSSPRADNFYA